MTTLTATKPLALNDVITLNPDSGWPARSLGVRLVVTKVPTRRNEVNFHASPCDADGNAIPGARGFKGPAHAFVPATGATESPVVTTIVRNPPVGSLVRPAAGGQIPFGVYVVIGETDAQRVRIMRLGGDNGRYWRANSRSLTIIDPSMAEAALANI